MSRDLTDYRRGERREGHRYELFFQHPDYDGGYAFDCDEAGVVDVETLMPIQLLSWERAHQPPYLPGRVRRLEWSYWQDPQGVCQCGRPVVLYDALWNGCDCGRWYNYSGQEVMSPEQYQRDVYPETGESVFDIYNGRDDDW